MTNTEAPTTRRTASKAYAEAATTFDESCDTLRQLLSGYEDSSVMPADCHDANWAHVGSLGHINDLLAQAIAHLTGEDVTR